MKSEAEETRFSVNIVIALVLLLVVVFGWGFLAGSYAGAHERKLSEIVDPHDENPDPPPARQRSRVRFFTNAIDQLPNLTMVISWHFRHRIWLPLLEIGVLVALIFGAVIMKRVDRELKKPYQVKHRKR